MRVGSADAEQLPLLHCLLHLASLAALWQHLQAIPDHSIAQSKESQPWGHGPAPVQ